MYSQRIHILLFVGCAFVAAPCSAEPDRSIAIAAEKVRQTVAHRGSSADRPENTISAFEQAIAAGASAFEVDVRTTKDGVLVVLHDETVDRTTSGTGKISDLLYADVEKLDAGSWFDPKFADQRVPRLATILQLAADRIDVLLDLKEQGSDFVARVSTEVKQHIKPSSVVVGVRSVEQAREIRAALPTARQLGLIPDIGSIDDFADAGVEMIRLWPRWLDGTNPVEKVRQRNLLLHLNGTTGAKDEVEQLLAHKPDSISSDDPAQLMATLRELALAKSTPERAARLKRFRAGAQYKVVITSSVSGELRPQPDAEPIEIVAKSSVQFRETTIDSDGAGVCYRVYDRIDYERMINGRRERAGLRDSINSAVTRRMENGTKLVFSPDGPLLAPELQLLESHPQVSILEEFAAANDLAEGSEWTAPPQSAFELTGVSQIKSGKLTCSYKGDFEHGNYKLHQIAVDGTVEGMADSGPVRDRLAGGVYVDQASGHLHAVRAVGTRTLLDQRGAPAGSLKVDFQISIRPLADDPDLALDKINKRDLEPSASNTKLIYDNATLGVKLQHPRTWKVVSEQNRQIILANNANTILISPQPPGRTPPTQKFHADVLQILRQANQKITSSQPVRANNTGAGRIANFRFDIAEEKAPVALDYWLIERDGLGATFAARLQMPVANERLRDIEAIVRSAVISAPTNPPSAE